MILVRLAMLLGMLLSLAITISFLVTSYSHTAGLESLAISGIQINAKARMDDFTAADSMIYDNWLDQVSLHAHPLLDHRNRLFYGELDAHEDTSQSAQQTPLD